MRTVKVPALLAVSDLFVLSVDRGQVRVYVDVRRATRGAVLDQGGQVYGKLARRLPQNSETPAIDPRAVDILLVEFRVLDVAGIGDGQTH